jgi:Signal transduction histidine kinase
MESPTLSNDIITALVVTVLFIVLFSFLMIMVVVNYVGRKRKILLERQEREAALLQQILQAQLEMQDQTLKSISQEIHDNVGQTLSLAKLNLNILSMNASSPEVFDDTKSLVSKAISDLRDLSAGYYADKLAENGLLAAIKHETEQVKKTGAYEMLFSSGLDSIRTNKNTTIFLYRMVQEIFNNIIKHSAAKNISVDVFKENEKICIKICDDGVGFDVENISPKAGMGLHNMRQRAKMIDADILVESQPQQGTSITLTFKEEE